VRCYLNTGLVLAVLASGVTRISVAQAKPNESVTQKAERQFRNALFNAAALGNGIFLFSGDGANVVAIADDSSTLLVDSGITSRVDELAQAIGSATHRPVTTLINTSWHFDHTGGNTFFGSAGVVIVAQENIAKELASVGVYPSSVSVMALIRRKGCPGALSKRTWQSSKDSSSSIW
jgi:alkyl sulfatase BDS1-like metallo-beta-lactamase superfamily hydrolase